MTMLTLSGTPVFLELALSGRGDEAEGLLDSLHSTSLLLYTLGVSFLQAALVRALLHRRYALSRSITCLLCSAFSLFLSPLSLSLSLSQSRLRARVVCLCVCVSVCLYLTHTAYSHGETQCRCSAVEGNGVPKRRPCAGAWRRGFKHVVGASASQVDGLHNRAEYVVAACLASNHLPYSQAAVIVEQYHTLAVPPPEKVAKCVLQMRPRPVSFTFQTGSERELLADWCLPQLCRLFSFKDIVVFFTALLLEKSVLVISDNLNEASAIV